MQLTEDASDSPKCCELGTAATKEPFRKEALILLLRPRNLGSSFRLQADVTCDAREAQPIGRVLHSHSGLTLGNPLPLFSTSPMTRDAAKSAKDCLEPFISGGCSYQATHCTVLYIELIWSKATSLLPAGLRRWSSETLRIVGCSCDHTWSLCRTQSLLPSKPCQCTWNELLWQQGVTSVFQLGHLPINHRQIKGPDRSRNFSLARCNLYCSTLNPECYHPPFSQIASQKTSKGPISLLTKFSSPMHCGLGYAAAARMQKARALVKTQSFPSTAAPVHCAVTVQIPRFIPT